MMKRGCLRAAALFLAATLLSGCGGGAASLIAAEAGAPAAAATTAPESTAPESTPAPTAGQPETTENTENGQGIDLALDTLTVRQKVGQLFVIRPDSLDLSLSQDAINDAHSAGVTALSDAMRETLAQYPVGGIAVFGKNVADPDQLTAFMQDLQAAGEIGLFTGIDEEGGAISRLANHPAFTLPQYESAAAVGDTGDAENAREMGKTIGGYLAQSGLNLDFAPDADVNTNPDNPVIGTRAFSSDPDVAARMVEAAVGGFHAAGVMSCIKHFPGHGDTSTDSHYGCATTDKTWAEMLDCEIKPFAAGVSAQTDMVMVAHITTPNVTGDGLPASLSPTMIGEKLRAELGFDGVVITDSLAMEAITDDFTPGEAAKLALAAGADLLLMPNGLTEAFDAVADAVDSGEITMEALDEHVRRVLTLKQEYGLL